MCGIAGIYRPFATELENRELVERAASTMLHRGPDGRGLYVAKGVALAMTRLAIIDVGGSKQPLSNECGDIHLVCNGEIYNYKELREELRGLGHELRTDGDCETIVHAYEQWGIAGISRLRGMFAFALWDDRQELLVVARDRLGIKPLYWARLGDGHAFCSEIRGLVSTGVAGGDLAEMPLLGYLRYGYSIHSARSLLAGVERVVPGTAVEIGRSGARVTKYWEEPRPSSEGSLFQLNHELAVSSRVHLRSDVEMGILLSSGLDSSLIAVLAVQNGVTPKVFTAGYRGGMLEDESDAALQFAACLGLPSQALILDTEQLFAGFAEMTSRVDEPAADPSSVVQWLLYRFCRDNGCRVVQTGIGGDEAFLGYTVWNGLSVALELAQEVPGRADQLLRMFSNFSHLHMGQVSEEEGLFGVQPTSMGRARLIGQLWAAGDLGRTQGATDCKWTGFHDVYGAIRRTYLPNNGFLLADKLGMAASVEVRVPLADHLLLESTLSLPLSFQRPQNGYSKPILRAALEAHGVEGWATRKKRGFEVPLKLVAELVLRHMEELRASPTARLYFGATKWNGLLDLFRRVTAAPGRMVRSRDSIKRRAWILSVTSEPDLWSMATLLYSVLCLDRCRSYWASNLALSVS